MGILKSVPDHRLLQRQPLDVQYEIGTVDTEAGPLVVLEMRTPAGEQTYFFPPESADKLAANLSTIASKARVGLIVPQLLQPNGNRQQRRHRG